MSFYQGGGTRIHLGGIVAAELKVPACGAINEYKNDKGHDHQ